MRKNSASGVLASLSGSTYHKGTPYAPSLAAALLDELFAHPAYTLMTNAPHKLIPASCAKIDLFAAC